MELKKYTVFAILGVIIIAVFGQTLYFDFVQFDEEDHISNRQLYLRSFSSLGSAFLHNNYYPVGNSQFYRPIHTISYKLDVMRKISPAWSHTINIAIHIGVALSLYFLFLEFGITRLKSLAVTLLFSVHPVASRVVAWVPGRNESLLALFSILSFLMFMKFAQRGKWLFLILHLVFFLLAIFTKETAVVLPLLCILWLFLVSGITDNFSKKWRIMTIIWPAIYFIWGMLRNEGLKEIVAVPFLALLSGFFGRVAGILLYIPKVLVPVRPEVFPTVSSVDFILGILSVIAFGIVSVLLVHKGILERKKLFFGLIWFFVWLMPSLIGYESTADSVFFEHRLYLPIIGIFIIIGSVNTDLIKKVLSKRTFAAAVAVIFSVFVVFTVTGSRQFKDSLTFWRGASENAPLLAKTHKGLGLVYAQQEKYEEAMSEFERALELNPDEVRVHNDIGIIYLKQQRLIDAAEEFSEEIEINPAYAIAHNNLAFAYAAQQRYSDAEKSWITALALNPWYHLPHQGLAILYTMLGKPDPALEHMEMLVNLVVPLIPELEREYKRLKSK